jgi:hypothetical protein
LTGAENFASTRSCPRTIQPYQVAITTDIPRPFFGLNFLFVFVFIFHIVSLIIVRSKYPLKAPQIIQISITQHLKFPNVPYFITQVKRTVICLVFLHSNYRIKYCYLLNNTLSYVFAWVHVGGTNVKIFRAYNT